jgi:hypothetical protein
MRCLRNSSWCSVSIRGDSALSEKAHSSQRGVSAAPSVALLLLLSISRSLPRVNRCNAPRRCVAPGTRLSSSSLQGGPALALRRTVHVDDHRAGASDKQDDLLFFLGRWIGLAMDRMRWNVKEIPWSEQDDVPFKTRFLSVFVLCGARTVVATPPASVQASGVARDNGHE